MVLVKTIFQFASNGTFLENIAVRSTGTLLTTRLDVPEVFEINPFTGHGAPLITIPGHNTTTGIAELRPDVFAIGAGNYSLTTGAVPGTLGIWLVDLHISPEPTLVVTIAEAGLVNGLARLNDKTVLFSDSQKGKVYAVDVAKKSYSIKMEGEAFEPPPDAPLPVGVNGLKILTLNKKTYLYFTNSFRQQFSRVEIDHDANPVGAVEVVAQGFFEDDFAIRKDGTAFVTTHIMHSVVKVLPDGEWSVIAGNETSLEVAGDTSCAFGRKKKDENVLYVVTSGAQLAPVGGVIEPAKVVAIDLD
jgi:hypothetical protein